MEFWKYYDVTHKEHLICNPTSVEKLNGLIDLMELGPDSKVLEIATGKGEFLIRLIENYNVSGIGVDLSPYHLGDARRKAKERVPNAELKLIEMDGADYKPDEPECFDLACCLGASWIYNGHKGTLKYLMNQTKHNGLIVVGEPFWICTPSEEYFNLSELKYETYSTHLGNVQIGENLGLNLLYTFVSNSDEWDRYLGLQWYATDKYIQANPDDPDIPELLTKLNKEKYLYLNWERDTLGWAIYVFRKPK
ncbi:MAG: methyltransferase domain-containing protein [Candidatus Lokiarchaeota archaeon]|nr:methyltransferase domain-containing protein [Candidatus Lokiarchaeota archaeon]